MPDEREEQITDLSMQRTRVAREERVDYLEDTRNDRATEIEADRVRRADQVAYAQGRRDADVDSRLLDHERRLVAINGSIKRHAETTASLQSSVDRIRESLEGKIDKMLAAQDTRTAVEADRIKEEEKRTAELKRANDRQISQHAWIIGVGTIVLMLLGLIATVLIGTHAI
jgi:hypothetical protein